MIVIKQITFLLFNTITSLFILNKYYYSCHIEYQKELTNLKNEISNLKKDLQECNEKLDKYNENSTSENLKLITNDIKKKY